MERKIESFNPHIVASSALATCNTYVVARTLETVKKVDHNILTVTGGQHFTATARESLEEYPVIDVIVRGEGEQTLAELVKSRGEISRFPKIEGISFRCNGKVKHNPPRPLIENLDSLPYPGYHFVKDFVHKYRFSAMAGGNVPYALIGVQEVAHTVALSAPNGSIGREGGGLNLPSVLRTKWSSATGNMEAGSSG